MDDPTFQEFYSLSRSTSQDQSLNLINTTSQDQSSRPTSRLQHRPSNDLLYTWSQNHASIPSIAHEYLYPGNQDNYFQSNQHLLNPLQRRHTTNVDSEDYADSTFDNDTASLNDDRSYQNDLRGTPILRPSQPYYQDTPEDDPRMEQLHDHDDYEGSYQNQQSRTDNDSYHTNNNGDDNQDDTYSQIPYQQQQQQQEPQEPNPLPKIPLFVLSVVIFSEPLTSTILFPFVYFMFCTSIFWGFMSDRYGRRPILLFGLCGSGIACVFFGLSKSLAWAITSRAMCGLLNGNVGVAKSMLGEISDKTNQSQAFSVFGFAWGIGMIVGPVLGGYLANPAKNFPETFGNWPFFIEYPYFLPCFVASLGNVVGFTVGYFFLEETRGKRKRYAGDSTEQESYSCQKDGEFLDPVYRSEGVESYTSHRSASIISRPISPFSYDNERQPLIVSQPQHIKFRKNMNNSKDYGSAATLTHDMDDHSGFSHIPNTFQSLHSVSARSTLSHRPSVTRPSIIFHQRATSASGAMPMLGNSLPTRGYSINSDDLPQGHQVVSEDVAFCGYNQDQSTEVHGPCGHESGRLSRMSYAPSQVYVLPADPNSKESNQPVQIIVVQQEGISPLSVKAVIAYAVLALHSIVFEEVYTLYAVTPLKSHGLGWSAILLSKSLASMGLVQLFMQFVVYPKMERRFSAVLLFRAGQLMYMGIYLTFPLIRALLVNEEGGETAGQAPHVYYIVLVGLVFKHLASVFSYTSVMVMINNSSPDHLLGTVNGIGQMAACLMRACGPALGGIVWAWSLSNKLNFPFNYFFVFFLMAAIAILEFIHSLSIPRDAGVKS
ncbi:hypothetical protein BGZ76_003006 [Entomortierella beljakovae]|nr:hypothetical protein BGZ76_003006 [Entomortierella beljakovae]